jgi:hypothetical protein
LASGDFGDGFDIPSIDPLYLADYSMVAHGYQTKFTNIVVFGAKNFILQNVE